MGLPDPQVDGAAGWSRAGVLADDAAAITKETAKPLPFPLTRSETSGHAAAFPALARKI